MKFGWDRIAHRDLAIATRHLDAVTAPQSADVPGGYGDSGFHVRGLHFPSPSCWQVSGTVRNTSLTFVVNAVRRRSAVRQLMGHA